MPKSFTVHLLSKCQVQKQFYIENNLLRALNNSKVMFFKKLALALKPQCTANYVTKGVKPEIPSNPLKEVYSASSQATNGVVYDRKPFKVRLEAGKTYSWCLCGRSKNNPLCDGTHKDVFLKIKERPIRFTVEKTKDYWLCNCKQTKNRPFCDGTHKSKEVVEATNVKV